MTSETLEIWSHSLSDPGQHPALRPGPVAQNRSSVPHRTADASQSLPEDRALAFKSPPSISHRFSQNAPELPAVCAQPFAPSPPSGPSHPEPLLLGSVTFTPSVSAHLASSSGLRSGPAAGLPPAVPAVAPRLTTPPQALSPPPPELTPPPAQQLGSDDEEQEDPTDYCKGERSNRAR